MFKGRQQGKDNVNKDDYIKCAELFCVFCVQSVLVEIKQLQAFKKKSSVTGEGLTLPGPSVNVSSVA